MLYRFNIIRNKTNIKDIFGISLLKARTLIRIFGLISLNTKFQALKNFNHQTVHDCTSFLRNLIFLILGLEVTFKM